MPNTDPSTSTETVTKPVRQCSLPGLERSQSIMSDNKKPDEPRDLPCISAKVQSRNVLKRAMTLPVQPEADEPQPLLQLGPTFNYAPLRSPMRTSGKPLVPNSETSETLLDVPVLLTTAASTASTAASKDPEQPPNLPAFEIPTFTVTINPLESNEMTFVPGSPPSVNESNHSLEQQPLLNKEEAARRIANTTVIVDDEVKNNLLMLNNGQVLHSEN